MKLDYNNICCFFQEIYAFLHKRYILRGINRRKTALFYNSVRSKITIDTDCDYSYIGKRCDDR